MFFTKQPIYSLSINTVERLKVSLIKRLFDNWIYVSNPQNDDFDDFPFDGDKMLINRRKIYRINDDIVEMLNNGLIVDVYTNQM